MKRALMPVLSMALLCLAAGCCRLPICTESITFYRADDLNEGRPAAIDIIYPREQTELDQVIKEVGPANWFTSDLATKVYKESGVWLQNKVVTVDLENKGEEDEYMVIFAEFAKPEERPARGRQPYLVFRQGMKPKPRKHEYIFVHNGSLERLKGKLKRGRGR